jgi:hypothetical protein
VRFLVLARGFVTGSSLGGTQFNAVPSFGNASACLFLGGVLLPRDGIRVMQVLLLRRLRDAMSGPRPIPPCASAHTPHRTHVYVDAHMTDVRTRKRAEPDRTSASECVGTPMQAARGAAIACRRATGAGSVRN